MLGGVAALALASCSDATDTGASDPDWVQGLRARAGRLTAEQLVDARAFGRIQSGTAFLGRSSEGELLAVTARWYLTEGAGLRAEVGIPYFESAVASWRLVERGTVERGTVERGDVGPAARAARVGARARSGLDAAACDVLLLRASQIDGVELPSDVHVLGYQVPEIGEQVAIASGGATPDVASAPVRAIDHAARIEFDLPAGSDPLAWIGAPVIASDGKAFACVVALDWDGDDPAASDGLRATAQLLRPFLLSPPPLFGAPFQCSNPGFDAAVLDASGTRAFLGNPVLGGGRVIQWPNGATLYGESLPEGQGAGAFTPAGWLVTAGRTGGFALFDPVSGATVAHGRVPLTLVTSIAMLADGSALLGSSIERGVHVVALDRAVALERIDAFGTAIAAAPSGAPAEAAAALGGPEGEVLVVRTDGGAARALAPHADQTSALVFSEDGALLASGGYDGVVRVHDVESGAELWSSKSAGSDINALRFEATVLFVATGSIEDGPDGRVPRSCFVRVFDARTGRELARSHDHATPRIALLPLPKEASGARRIVGLGLGEEHFAFDLPEQ